MNVEKIEATFSNLEIAEIQLFRAVELFFEEDYISALTLSGAAEEILGKLLNKKGCDHWFDTTSKGALKALGYSKHEPGSNEAKKTKKEIADLVNYHKNRLKHFNECGSLTFLIDVEAASMIERAISNYFKLTKTLLKNMEVFRELVVYGEEA